MQLFPVHIKERRRSHFPLRSTVDDIGTLVPTSECFPQNDTQVYDNNDDGYYDGDVNARSMFGTKEYWDELYVGRGDFPADTYSWYTNWNEIQHYMKPYIISTATTTPVKGPKRIFLPGIGNDSLLMDMILAGYHHYHTLVAQDYSKSALERQIDLLESIDCYDYKVFRGSSSISSSISKNDNDIDIMNDTTLVVPMKDDYTATVTTISTKSETTNRIELYCCDITKTVPVEWYQSFDIIVEKGLLDAVYLSDNTNRNLHDAIQNIYQSLKNDGILISISSVIPTELRQAYFPSSSSSSSSSLIQQEDETNNNWDWIRDGSTDAKKAGCFIFRKL